jgi:hypothetical protein
MAEREDLGKGRAVIRLNVILPQYKPWTAFLLASCYCDAARCSSIRY